MFLAISFQFVVIGMFQNLIYSNNYYMYDCFHLHVQSFSFSLVSLAYTCVLIHYKCQEIYADASLVLKVHNDFISIFIKGSLTCMGGDLGGTEGRPPQNLKFEVGDGHSYVPQYFGILKYSLSS